MAGTKLSLKDYDSNILIACRGTSTVKPLRHALISSGFNRITTRNSRSDGLEEAKSGGYQIVFVDADRDSDPSLSIDRFLAALDLSNNELLVIPVASEPSVEGIFHVIKCGAKGYMIPPFTPASVEEVVVQAVTGPKLDPELLNADDRNRALATMILDNLDRVVEQLRKRDEVSFLSGGGGNRKEPAPGAVSVTLDFQSVHFAQSVQTARKFCEGGEGALVQKIMDVAIERGSTRTRLGETRSKLKEQRVRAAELVVPE